MAKKRRATGTSTASKEIKLYRLKHPDYYEKAVAAYSETEASKIVCGGVEWIDDTKLLRKMARRPGVVFRKLAGLQRDWEAWD